MLGKLRELFSQGSSLPAATEVKDYLLRRAGDGGTPCQAIKSYAGRHDYNLTDFNVRDANNYGSLYKQYSMAEILELRDKTVISDFRRNKLETEAQKNWDKFYKRNATKFFKDRHWTRREFSELCSESLNEERTVILEVGCGVGNFIFPLIEDGCNSYFYACDFSPRAVQFVRDHPLYSNNQICAFHCDITKDCLTDHVARDSVHIATMIFVLSAISPDKMVDALKNVFQVLVPGGMLMFRDYGLHDYAMLRFSAGHKISDNFYFRQDGTRAFYFSTDCFRDLATQAGFTVMENKYVQRETINKKDNLSVPRVFVQSKLLKPDHGSDAIAKPNETNSITLGSPDETCETHQSDNVSDTTLEPNNDTGGNMILSNNDTETSK